MLFRKRAEPGKDPTSIGNLLLNAGICTEKQMREALALKAQKEDELLGETLVRMGVITRGMLAVILNQQEILRTNGVKKAVHYAHTAAKTTLAFSGSLATITELSAQAISKLKA